jgi:hypothetical protein
MTAANDARRSIFNAAIVSALVQELSRTESVIAPGVAARVAGLVVLLGLLADALFNQATLGLNAVLWLGALSVALVLAHRDTGATIEGKRALLLTGSLTFAALAELRASETLQAFNVMATAALLLLAIALPPGAGLQRVGPLAFVLAAAAAGISFLAGAWGLLVCGGWSKRFVGGRQAEALSIARAFVIATPVVLAFGGLFVAADAVFEAEARRLVSSDVTAVIDHVAWTISGAWVATAVLWCALVVKTPADIEAELPETRRLRPVETGIILGPLTLLFALFVAVQVRYLFGGEEVVQQSLDLTYAEYARRGFFELVIASILLLPLLVGVNWARSRSRLGERLFQGLALALVALLFVIMASAWERLSIYIDTFGLTELRFYAAAVLPWLAVAFVWFLFTVAAGRRQYFAPGAGLAALVALVALNVASPDRVIAETNLSRISSGHSIDTAYVTSLSGDAVPVLVSRFAGLPASERCAVASALLQRWSEPSSDPRSWNLGRHRAHRAVAEQRALLEAACS